MDGYAKLVEMYDLINSLEKIDKEMTDLSKETDELPEMPGNMEEWTDSLSDLNNKSFKLSDFKKLFSINKKYEKLIENRNKKSSEMKILVIDNLMERIKDLLK